MMTGPKLALFYGGLVRKKNRLADYDAELLISGLIDGNAARSPSAIGVAIAWVLAIVGH